MSYQHKSGSTKKKRKGKKTLFELGWTSKPRASNAADTELHSQGNVQSESIVALSSSQTSPGSDAREINTGLEHNIEEASTSPKKGLMAEIRRKPRLGKYSYGHFQ